MPQTFARVIWSCRELPDRLALAAGARRSASALPLPRVRFHPALPNEAEFLDVYWKAMHYMPPGTVGRLDIPVDFTPSFSWDNPAQFPQPEYAAPVPAGARRDVRILREPRSSLAKALLAADLVYVWDWSSVREGGAAAASPRVRNVDRARNVNEAWIWSEYLHERQPPAQRAAARVESRRRLRLFLDARPRLKRAYVFGTGPSLEQAWTRDWSDGYRIVCNTIVNNRALLEHLKPHIVVAGDAAYHFDINRHAAAFRRDLEGALAAHDMLFITRELYGPLLAFHHPDVYRRTLLAEADVGIHFNALDRLVYHRWPHGNILNALLLPLGSALADEIGLLGFDGRAPNDHGFWKNAAASTYDALKPSIKTAHPGFFAIDFEAYAQAQSDNAETLMKAGESMGKRYVCLNDSYIPAFRKRRGTF